MPKKDDNILAEVEGKAVHINPFQGFQPAFYGNTHLELETDRIVEKTQYLFTQKESHVLLSKVEAVQYMTTGNTVLLALGFATLPILVGVVFLIVWIFIKYRYLAIVSPGITLVVKVKGDQEPYLDFMDRVMAQMEKLAKAQTTAEPRSAPVVSMPPPPLERTPAPQPQHVRATIPAAANTIRCTNCNSELNVPPGAPGRKFRCPNCKEILKAPPGM
jgi:hypothetical protein